MIDRTCEAPDCLHAQASRSRYCAAHASRLARKGEFGGPVRRRVGRGSRQCSVDGCSTAAVTRGWCQMHYTRWKRQGDPGEATPRPRIGCQVQGCKRKHYGLGYCDSHWRQMSVYGDIRPSFGPGARGWTTPETLSYEYAHDRVKRFRGPASTQMCDECEHLRAFDWAYDHCDVRELRSPEGYAYSIDLTRYRPMCRPCHKALDAWVLGGKYRPRKALEQP